MDLPFILPMLWELVKLTASATISSAGCGKSATPANSWGWETEQILHPRRRCFERVFTAKAAFTATFDVYNVATDDYITVNEIADITVEESGLQRSK